MAQRGGWEWASPLGRRPETLEPGPSPPAWPSDRPQRGRREGVHCSSPWSWEQHDLSEQCVLLLWLLDRLQTDA